MKEAGITESEYVEEFFKPDLIAFQNKILDSEVSSITDTSFGDDSDDKLERRYSMKKYGEDKRKSQEKFGGVKNKINQWKARVQDIQRKDSEKKLLTLSSLGKMTELMSRGNLDITTTSPP